jgi:DNA polymerase III subunit beta
MKLTCTQENLNFGLSLVSHLASKSTNLPILNNVLLKAEKGELQLITTNLEMGIKLIVRGKIDKEGSFTVQAKLLSDYIGLLPKENVNLEVDEGNLNLKCLNYQTQIRGLEATEFPLLPEIDKKNKIVVSADELKKAVNRVAFCAALDESRPEISGVLFKINEKKLIIAATDSYRLAEKRVEVSESNLTNSQIIIPLKTIQELQRILFSQMEKNLTIYFNENQVLFSIDNVELISRLIEGQYPDYEQIIPTQPKTKAKIKVGEFLQAVKSASLFCKPGINDVKLTLVPGSEELVVMASNANLGENITNLKINLTGEENEIVFNYRFLIDGLNNIDTEFVNFEVTNNAIPGVFKPINDDNYLYIIMPIRQ